MRRRHRRRGAAPLPGLYACGMFALRAGSDACISPRCLRRGQAAGQCEHRPLRMQGPAGFCRVSLPPGGDAPLSRLAPTAPLAGAPLGNRLKKASPARGCRCAAGADGGVHCRVAFYGIFPGCAKPAQGPMIFHQPGEGGGCRKARGTMQASSPTHARACRVLQDISAAGRRCTPQSAGADSSPCRGAFGTPAQKSLPCKGRWMRRRRGRRGAAPCRGFTSAGCLRCARRERRLHQPALSAPRTGSGTMRASSPTHAR